VIGVVGQGETYFRLGQIQDLCGVLNLSIVRVKRRDDLPNVEPSTRSQCRAASGCAFSTQRSSRSSSSGIPKAITDLTLIATFNDLDSVARLLDEHEAGDVSYAAVRDYVARRRPEIHRTQAPREPRVSSPRTRRPARSR